MLAGRPLTESLKAGKSGALGFLEERVSVGSSGVKVRVEAKVDQLTIRQGWVPQRDCRYMLLRQVRRVLWG